MRVTRELFKASLEGSYLFEVHLGPCSLPLGALSSAATEVHPFYNLQGNRVKGRKRKRVLNRQYAWEGSIQYNNEYTVNCERNHHASLSFSHTHTHVHTRAQTEPQSNMQPTRRLCNTSGATTLSVSYRHTRTHTRTCIKGWECDKMKIISQYTQYNTIKRIPRKATASVKFLFYKPESQKRREKWKMKESRYNTRVISTDKCDSQTGL